MVMVNIALVDDEKKQTDFQEDLLKKYRNINPDFVAEISVFNSPLEFLEKYEGQFDIIFMDMEMPGFTGLETSSQIRKIDSDVSIVFITNYAKFALQGYEYQASAYLVKPVSFETFSDTLDKLLLKHRRKEEKLVLKINGELLVLPFEEIVYVEKKINYLLFHTLDKGEVRCKGTIKELEEKMNDSFDKPINGVLVNLSFVVRTDKSSIYLKNGETIPLSRHLRKEFEDALIRYLGA